MCVWGQGVVSIPAEPGGGVLDSSSLKATPPDKSGLLTGLSELMV